VRRINEQKIDISRKQGKGGYREEFRRTQGKLREKKVVKKGDMEQWHYEAYLEANSDLEIGLHC